MVVGIRFDGNIVVTPRRASGSGVVDRCNIRWKSISGRSLATPPTHRHERRTQVPSGFAPVTFKDGTIDRFKNDLMSRGQSS